MAEDLPRIQAKSKADILQVRQTLASSLQSSLGRKAKRRDAPAKRRGEAVRFVEGWLANTFTAAKSNIEVNGRPYTQAFAEDEVELFDVKLKEEVTELQQRVDEMTAKVCALRRGIPPEAKRLAEETVLWEAEAYARKVENVSRKEEILPGKGQTGLAEMSLEEIQKEYTASMGKIKDIMMDLPAIEGHLERALGLAQTFMERVSAPVDPAVELLQAPLPRKEEAARRQKRKLAQEIMERIDRDRKRRPIPNPL